MTDTPLTDDYVAELLKKDAKSVSARATAGLGFFDKRPSGSAPKPNTRFLRNILRDTDAHNSALLAREEEESRARLEALRRSKQRDRKGEQQLYSVRARREGGESASKRRRVEESGEEHNSHDSEVRDRGHRHVKSAMASRHSVAEGSRRRGEHHHRRRSRSPERGESGKQSHRNRTSPVTAREDAMDQHRNIEDAQKVSRHRSREGTSRRRQRSPSTASSDASLGPRRASRSPPLRSRGRGAAFKTTMDAHFDNGYDPSADVRLSDDELDDWDQALEALRDRQKWKQKGAERLKAAGFTDQEVEKWETGGSRDADDVRWVKRGERREWDRGKETM